MRLVAGHHKDQWLDDWKFQPHPNLWEWRCGASQALCIRDAWTRRFYELLVWWICPHAERVKHPSSVISGPHPMYLFIWLFMCILYNKLVNVNKCSSEFCEQIKCTHKRDHENLLFKLVSQKHLWKSGLVIGGWNGVGRISLDCIFDL